MLARPLKGSPGAWNVGGTHNARERVFPPVDMGESYMAQFLPRRCSNKGPRPPTKGGGPHVCHPPPRVNSPDLHGGEVACPPCFPQGEALAPNAKESRCQSPGEDVGVSPNACSQRGKDPVFAAQDKKGGAPRPRPHFVQIDPFRGGERIGFCL